MSTLPFISHRLFAAAIGREDSFQPGSSRNRPAGAPAARSVPIPLELLEGGKAAHLAVTRSLRTTLSRRAAG